MTVYRYRAVRRDNSQVEDRLDADSVDAVRAHLKRLDLVPLEVKAARRVALRLPTRRRSAIDAVAPPQTWRRRDLLAWTDQLANLLSAGLTLDRALRVIVDTGSERVAPVADCIRARLRTGKSLASALEAEDRRFPVGYLQIVEAGELGGTLPANLARLSASLERADALRQRLVSALVYPTMLLALAIGSVVVLVTFVVPRFVPIFEDLGGELPWLTRVVLVIGTGMRRYGWIGLPVSCAIGVAARRHLRHPAVRRRVDRWALRLPLLGDLVCVLDVAQFGRTLGTLLDSGVPLMTALSIAGGVLRNQALATSVEAAARAVRGGARLADALRGTGDFPSLAMQMVQVGEETGNLGGTLTRLAEIYERESNVTIDRMMAALVPTLTLGLAVVIGLIVTSILMAILNLNQLIM